MKARRSGGVRFLATLASLGGLAGCAGAEDLDAAGPRGVYVSPQGPHKLLVEPDRLAGVIAEESLRPTATLDYGGRKLLTVDDEQFQRLDLAALRERGVEVRDDLNLIRLRSITLDTTVKGEGPSRDPGYGLYLIQFATPADDDRLREIDRIGAEKIDYVPNNAFLMWVPRDARRQLASLSAGAGGSVWLSPFVPDWKIDPALKRRESEGSPVSVVVAFYAAPGFEESVRKASSLGTILAEPVEAGRRVSVTLRCGPGDLQRIAELPHVTWVEEWKEPTLFQQAPRSSPR